MFNPICNGMFKMFIIIIYKIELNLNIFPIFTFLSWG